MRQHRFNGLLLRPSLFSSIVCGLLAVGAIIGANWSFILQNVLFYDYFFGPEGLVTTLQASQDGGAAIENALTSQSFMRNSIILFGAIGAGLLLFVLLKIIVSLMNNISMTFREMNAVEGPAKDAVEHELEKRIGIRILVAIVWAAFTFVSVKVILPFCILASQLGLSEDSDVGDGIGYVLFALVLLFATLHAHVVMARLFLLKPRVFGGEEAVLSE